MAALLTHLLWPLLAAGADPARIAVACPPAAAHCFGIHVHLTVSDGTAVQTPAWVADQIDEANRLFAPLGVGFQVAELSSNDGRWAEVNTRLDRDLLGRRVWAPGVVHVFVVRRLGDVDVEGEEIRGVHWRDRADPTQRWIILSALGNHRVLAHELGHFFGLPHSRHPASIMNKTPRESPPPEARGFPPSELARMERGLHRMVSDGTLHPRKPTVAPG